jgi:hypothetical protein
LKGKASWFLPFNQGWNDGAGNPPNQDGLKTDYLWKRILTPRGLTDILENYAQIVEIENPKTKKKKRAQIWPRYHQLAVVRGLLADASMNGAGKRYLIQHSAGSGKSNSIAWLAHPLIGLAKDGTLVFDSVIVVTDRRILDKQIQDTIKQFGCDRRPCRALRRPAQIHRERQENHYFYGPEISVHSRWPYSWLTSAPSTATAVSPSSSTRRIPARADARRRTVIGKITSRYLPRT